MNRMLDEGERCGGPVIRRDQARGADERSPNARGAARHHLNTWERFFLQNVFIICVSSITKFENIH